MAGGNGLAGRQPLDPKYEHDWRRGETRLGLFVVTAVSYAYDFWNFLRSGNLRFYTIEDLMSVTSFIGTEREFALKVPDFQTALPGLDRMLTWFFTEMGISHALLALSLLALWAGMRINRRVIDRCDRYNRQIAIDNLRRESLQNARELDEDIRHLQAKQKDLEKYLLETIRKIQKK